VRHRLRPLRVDVRDDQAVPIMVLVEADIVEVFVDDRYALAARLPARPGDRRLSVHGAGEGASVVSFRISPLTAVE